MNWFSKRISLYDDLKVKTVLLLGFIIINYVFLIAATVSGGIYFVNSLIPYTPSIILAGIIYVTFMIVLILVCLSSAILISLIKNLCKKDKFEEECGK